MGNFLKRNHIEVQPVDSPEVDIDVDIDEMRAARLAQDALIQSEKLRLYKNLETPAGFISSKDAYRAQDQARENVQSMNR